MCCFLLCTLQVRNAGPTVANIDLMIYWPLMAAGQDDVAASDQTYYFYPFEFTVSVFVESGFENVMRSNGSTK